MVIVRLGILGCAVHTTYTVTRTTIGPSYQLTPEDVASLNFQTHGELIDAECSQTCGHHMAPP